MYGSSGTMITQPSSRNSRLPRLTRRASGGDVIVLSIASRPLPRLAPSTRPSATCSEITFDVASVAVSSTTARLEYDSIVNTAATSMSSSTSPVSEAKMTLTPAPWVSGLRGEHDELQRQDDQAEADQHAAEAPDLVSTRGA